MQISEINYSDAHKPGALYEVPMKVDLSSPSAAKDVVADPNMFHLSSEWIPSNLL